MQFSRKLLGWRGCRLAAVLFMAGLTLGAADPLDAVRAAIQRGEKEITVRPGRYFIHPEDAKGD